MTFLTSTQLTIFQARRFAKAMRASLIFSSTSHSINVQKVHLFPLDPQSLPFWPHLTSKFPSNNPSIDLQNRPLQSLRPKMHNPRNRERRRTAPPLPTSLTSASFRTDSARIASHTLLDTTTYSRTSGAQTQTLNQPHNNLARSPRNTHHTLYKTSNETRDLLQPVHEITHLHANLTE